jgi:hypothetical protein
MTRERGGRPAADGGDIGHVADAQVSNLCYNGVRRKVWGDRSSPL